MRCETPGPSEESTEDQRNAHCDLNRKIQVRTKAGMSTEKTFHRAHFLTGTKPPREPRRRTAFLESSLQKTFGPQ
jgi:hypothetical protein